MMNILIGCIDVNYIIDSKITLFYVLIMNSWVIEEWFLIEGNKVWMFGLS